MLKTVLTIAGSDPTGGAGIQADIKTMTAIGVYGAAAITCITVQNSFGVSRVEPLHPALVSEQIEAVLADHQVTHIKIGMIGTAAIARAISLKLQVFDGEVIFDPVLLSTTGQQLMAPEDLDRARADLLPKITVLTPNLPELEKLTGMTAHNQDEISAAVCSLFSGSKRLKGVLVKGGHAKNGTVVTDSMYYSLAGGKVESEALTHSFLKTVNSHGTGCTLASAFAAFHALGGDYSSAFRQAVFFVQKLLRQSVTARVVSNPKGKGGLLHHLACEKNSEL
ncbi:MAG: bifunctional hydroxymethylpyrimidine kinase/phosphomethylpyrimidine kinase [Desulfobulbaceae bacterium]